MNVFQIYCIFHFKETFLEKKTLFKRLVAAGLELRVLYCRNAGHRSLALPEESILEDLWVDRNSLGKLNLAGQLKLNRLLCDYPE